MLVLVLCLRHKSISRIVYFEYLKPEIGNTGNSVEKYFDTTEFLKCGNHCFWEMNNELCQKVLDNSLCKLPSLDKSSSF